MTSSGPCSSEEMIRLQEMVDDTSRISIATVLKDYNRPNYCYIVDASLEFQRVAIQMETFCSRFNNDPMMVSDDEKAKKEHTELTSRLREKYEKWKNEINRKRFIN